MSEHGDRWTFAALVALIVWLPLPWGSKPEAAVAGFGLVVAVLVIAQLLLRPPPDLPGATRLVLGLWLAWLGWCALHIPLGILPGASVDALILSGNYLALFWLVLATCARNRARQRLVLWAIVFAGVAEALYGSVMTLSGIEYGFFGKKWFGEGYATGTFVNRNHFAGYLELAGAAGVALVLADLRVQSTQTWRQRLRHFVDLLLSPRIRVRVMIAVMVIALVLTRSRAGNVAFFVALASCGLLYVALRQPKYLLKSLLFFVSLFAVDLLIVSENYGLQKVAERIEQTDIRTEQRFIAFRDLAPAVKQYAVVGAGPGAFGAAFAPYRSAELVGYFDHAHNDFAEFAIETGVVGLALVVSLGAITLIHAFLVLRRRRDPMAGALAFAATMGLVALGIHGLADFNLRIPANAATLVVLMALCLSVSSRSRVPPAAPSGGH